ncbi:MAG TPA: ABC transporter permease [Azospirillaceae bacterium]|nr:ABC transporter permease [Azospirillaceae bacterium]
MTAAATLLPRRRRLAPALRRPAVLASAAVLALLALACFCAPLLEAALGVDATSVSLLDRFGPPTAQHPLGTDELGRDVLVRLLQGGQVSLTVGLLAALLASAVGTGVGLVSGYYGGRLDQALMRFTDLMVAIPVLPLLIILAALDPAKLPVPAALSGSEDFSLYRIVLIIALFGWTTAARLVRADALSVRRRDYVRAAVALGAGPSRVMLAHILPNVVSPVLVSTTLSVGNIVLLESVLSFLGLGIQPPLPSWGNMLTGAQDLIWSAPMLAVYPGLLIFVTVICFNFLGDGLQEALDPRARGERR